MNRFSARLFGIGLALGAIGAAAVLAVNAYAGTKPSHTPARHTRTEASGQPVIDWDQLLLSIVNTPGAQPANIQPTRNFAILHAAIYDAVNAIDRAHQPYLIAVRAPRNASETAAADAAARTALAGLYPSQQTSVDATYATELANVADGPAKDQGVRLGNQVATDLLANPRKRRLEHHAADVRPRHRTRRLPTDAAQLPHPRLHQLGAGRPVRARHR